MSETVGTVLGKLMAASARPVVGHKNGFRMILLYSGVGPVSTYDRPAWHEQRACKVLLVIRLLRQSCFTEAASHRSVPPPDQPCVCVLYPVCTAVDFRWCESSGAASFRR